MLVETVLSMLTLVCHMKKVMHREGVFTGTLGVHHGGLQCAGPWHGFQPTASGFVPLSIAEFSL